MLNLPPSFSRDISTSRNASGSIIGSGCSSEVSVDGYDEETLDIFQGHQYSQNPVFTNKNQSQINILSVRTEECNLSGCLNAGLF